ncbi:MAG TPA: hypothetical protein VJV79_13360 [Polyangiaceae bacterium]|nr:hypothetical protein [Polyangiaceae bacterium]
MPTISEALETIRAVRSYRLLVAAAFFLGVHGAGCSSDGTSAGTGGSNTAFAGSGSGGRPGGAGSPGMQTGGAGAAAGAPASAAGSSAAGSSAAGSSAAGSSAAGSSAAGSAGTLGGGGAGGSGGGGSSTTAKPSAGCSAKTPRPSGGQVQVANTSIYMFPESYDGTKPFPLVIALHACGNPNTEFVGLTNNTGFATDYVRAFPNTPDSGQCWSNYNADVARVTAQYDELASKYCIDQNRVFGIGHSSGSQLLVNILAHKADAQHLNFKGVSPVAADPFNVALPTPILYIHGQMDNQRSADSAKNTMAKFRAANSCMDSSKPYAAVMQCNSTDSGRPLVNPGCIAYDGCSVPTIWCSHNDPSYSGTQHGVPCFAIKSMYDFFGSL